MSVSELEKLEIGNLVRHANGSVYIVIETWPHIVAIRSINVTNPSEWELIKRTKI